MSTQPKALFLADVIDNDPRSKTHHDAAAAELRRLHDEVESLRQAYNIVTDDCRNLTEKVIPNIRAQRDALLEALKQIEPILTRMYGPQAAELPPMQVVCAAIAKAEEGK